MTFLFKLFKWPLIITVLISLYFSTNIYGYYRFKAICEREAGLHLYQPLQRNVGWSIPRDYIGATTFPMHLDDVAFVRYKDRDGHLYDVYRSPRLKAGDRGYTRQPADTSKPVIYQYNLQTTDRIPDELRMSANHHEVTKLDTGQLALRYSEFGYSKFEQENTILAAPSGVGCPEDHFRRDPKTGKALPLKIEVAFINSFAKPKE